MEQEMVWEVRMTFTYPSGTRGMFIDRYRQRHFVAKRIAKNRDHMAQFGYTETSCVVREVPWNSPRDIWPEPITD